MYFIVIGMSHRRQSLTRQQSDGFNEIQLTQSNAYGHQFSSKLNKSGRSYAWTKNHGMRVPENMSYSEGRPPKSSNNDDDNVTFSNTITE